MRETSDLLEIVNDLRIVQPRIIGIDGVDGSGKSVLASSLSEELGYPHLNLDDFLEENRGEYAKHIRYNDLQKWIADTIGPIIIEGVCLLAVLERLNQCPDVLIYVKRISDYGSWRDEDDCEVNDDIDEFISQKHEELQKFVLGEAYIEGSDDPNDISFPQFAEEVIRYHFTYRPHRNADVIYNRVD
jgi:uridine kinase